MKRRYYFVKRLAPWMLSELYALACNTDFTLFLFREQENRYSKELAKLNKKGVKIITRPFSGFSIQRFIYVIFFFIGHIKLLCGFKNFAFSIISAIWFTRLDLSFFKYSNISIHAQFATQSTIIAYLIKRYKKNRITYSFTTHAHDIFFNNRWLPVLVHDSDCMITISQYNKSYIRDYYRVDNSKIIVNYLGVERTNNRKALSSCISSQICFKFGFISWLVKKKGLLNLLRTVSFLVKSENRNFKIIVAGEGPLEREAKEFVNNNSLNKYVEFLGSVYGEGKQQFFNTIDALVMPSIDTGIDKDGIPVVLMEAISYGLPLVCSDISGLPEICIDGYNGIVFNNNNVKELESVLIGFITNHYDLLEFSRNAIVLSKRFDNSYNTNIKIEHIGW